MRFVQFAGATTGFASDSDNYNVHATVNKELVGYITGSRLIHFFGTLENFLYIISNQRNAFDIKIRDLNPYESFNSQIPWHYT